MPEHETPTPTAPHADLSAIDPTLDSTLDSMADRAKSASLRKRRPAAAELRDRIVPTDHLWTIEVVAAFLQCSVREPRMS